jgi:hypothetical protein
MELSNTEDGLRKLPNPSRDKKRGTEYSWYFQISIYSLIYGNKILNISKSFSLFNNLVIFSRSRDLTSMMLISDIRFLQFETSLFKNYKISI